MNQIQENKTKIKDYKTLSEDIVNWIKDYALSNKLDSLIVGVSGGCDSGLVSTLCAKTGLPCFFYGIPINSTHENNKNSFIQLEWLRKNFENASIDITDLSEPYKLFVEKVTFKNRMSDLARANTKSRLRMTLLWAMANTNNGLVVGCGNKPEDFGIFFYTIGGDGCVGISPIADLMKSQVREMGKFLGIPEEIHSAIATDGLWEDNRKDHEQTTLTYDEVEFAMDYRERLKYSPFILSDRQKQVLEIYNKLHEKGKFKSLPIPVFKVEHSKYQ